MAPSELRSWEFGSNWLPLTTNNRILSIGSNVGKGTLVDTGKNLFYTQRRQKISSNAIPSSTK